MPAPKSCTKIGSYTPREVAFDFAIAELYHDYHDTGGRCWVEDYDDRPHMIKKIKRQIAKLHNRLLEESGLDGVNIEVED